MSRAKLNLTEGPGSLRSRGSLHPDGLRARGAVRRDLRDLHPKRGNEGFALEKTRHFKGCRDLIGAIYLIKIKSYNKKICWFFYREGSSPSIPRVDA